MEFRRWDSAAKSVHSAAHSTCSEADVSERRRRWQDARRALCIVSALTLSGGIGHPISFVLHRKHGALLGALSATTEGPVALHLPTGDQAIGELIRTLSSGSQPNVTPIGGPAPTPTRVAIAATFAGVPLDFDFDTLEAPL